MAGPPGVRTVVAPSTAETYERTTEQLYCIQGKLALENFGLGFAGTEN